jgi:hypothetical protein
VRAYFSSAEPLTIESWIAAREQSAFGAGLEPLPHSKYIPIMVLKTQRYAGRVALDLSSSSARFTASPLNPLLKSLLIPAVALAPFVLTFACGGDSIGTASGLDSNHDKLADDLGVFADVNGDGKADAIDINGDGKVDGAGVNTSGNSHAAANALALDMDCDGIIDSLDTNGDGVPDLQTSRAPVTPSASCKASTTNPVTGPGGGSAGAPGAGGAPGAAGSPSHAGSAGAPPVTAGAGGGSVDSQLGQGTYQGKGSIDGSDMATRYAEQDVYRNGVGYKFIANGWGTNWKSHSISWSGTSFTVNSLEGTQGSDYSPAGYPSMFCGLYSQKQSDCSLPITISAAKSIKTGWRWKANGNNGQYNAAWDIWLGNSGKLSAYLMVWQRDPPGQQPAGSVALAGATVTGLPGSWNIWKGSVNGLPIVNYVQPEGKDLSELEFNVLDVYNDAIKRGYNLPGSQILAVAVGYEVWNGPVMNLVTEDFYVDVK